MRDAPIADQTKPILDLNTTPLIDVILVLLVMFIITLPLQTHAVKMDLPSPCRACAELNPRVNSISVDQADRISWNGDPVSKADLTFLLRRTQQMQPLPELHLRSDPSAKYGTVDEVLAIIKREHVSKFGFVGNEADRDVF